MRIALRLTFFIVLMGMAAVAYAEVTAKYETVGRYMPRNTSSCPGLGCPAYSLGPFSLDQPMLATDKGKIFWAKLQVVKADRHPGGFTPGIEVNDLLFHVDEIREVPFVTASWTKTARGAYLRGGDAALDITFTNPTDHRVNFVFKVVPGAFVEVALAAGEEKTLHYSFPGPGLHTTNDVWDFFIVAPFSRTSTGVGPLRDGPRQENAAAFTINVEGAFTIDPSQAYVRGLPAMKVSVR